MQNTYRPMLLAIPAAFSLLLACQEPVAPAPPPITGQGPGTVDDWRKTDSLLAMMGDLRGRRVADLFAGDGHYTLALLKAGANVIAVENDQARIDALTAKAQAAGYGPDRLTTRLVLEGEPGIAPGEVDRALCTRTYLTIPESVRIPYFAKVHGALGHEGQLFVVEFLPMQTPMGPPLEQRASEELIMDELAPAGFSDMISWSSKLPYRYVIQAMELANPPQPGEEDGE